VNRCLRQGRAATTAALADEEETMPECPRCRHAVSEAPTVCSQCGCSIHAEPAAGQSRVPLAKVLLLVVLLALLTVLAFLALEYAQTAGQLGR
jgi:hypothetical protein